MLGTLVRALWSSTTGALRRSGGQAYAVSVVSPPGYMHSAAFGEVAESLHYALCALGHDSILTAECMLPGRRHIILGSNLLPRFPQALADDAILYNLEQVDLQSTWMRPELLALFRRHEVWDYSQRNALALEKLGVKVARVVPVGYVPELTRITHAPNPDIDVLFFGSMNPRREFVIQAMRSLGLRVDTPPGIYGESRDALIARSKLILNVHFYEAKVLEIVRLSYLLGNRCAVLSERGADPSEDNELADGVAFADYHDLARKARELVDNAEERARLARRGFDIIRTRRTDDYLRTALTAVRQR